MKVESCRKPGKAAFRTAAELGTARGASQALRVEIVIKMWPSVLFMMEDLPSPDSDGRKGVPPEQQKTEFRPYIPAERRCGNSRLAR